MGAIIDGCHDEFLGIGESSNFGCIIQALKDICHKPVSHVDVLIIPATSQRFIMRQLSIGCHDNFMWET